MQNEKQKGYRVRLTVWVTLAILSATVFFTVLGSVLYVQCHFSGLCNMELYRSGARPQSPRFYAYEFTDRSGRKGEGVDVTDEVYRQKQTAYLSYEELPEDLIHAFVAIEDKRFFEHSGVDLWRTAAAAFNYLLGFSDRFGASTITQQLVKNMTGENDISIGRKLREILCAWELERRLDKTEILELYLNVIHFSDNCDGVAAAAEHYFSKTVAELTVEECAAIAAITNHPSYYNPIRNPENNRARRDLILSEMHAQGYLTENEYQDAVARPITLRVDSKHTQEGVNSWYVDMVIDDVIEDLMEERGMSRAAAKHLLYTGGLRIDMAMDPQVQALIEEYYESAVHLPQNASGESAQSALIAIDSRTGDILGVAGAAGEKRGNHLQNFATQTCRPPASTIKPITVYAPALERGLVTWASVYDDVPLLFKGNTQVPWPKNANRIYRGLTDVAYAVAHSTNTVALRILDEVGMEEAWRMAKEEFGLGSLLESDRESAALGLGQMHYGVTLRELTAAYTAFADRGIYHAPRSYYRVLDANGRILLSRDEEGRVVLTEGNAAVMTKLLEEVVREGTSDAITLSSRVACAGKTGTSNLEGDRWFVGYTPDIVCGVWCGYEYPEPLTGRNPSTAIWNAVMQRIYSAVGGRTACSDEEQLIEVTYCRDSGRLPCELCEQDERGDRTATGWFVPGTEPTAFCDRHMLVSVEREEERPSEVFPPLPSAPEQQRVRVKVFRGELFGISVADEAYVYDPDRRIKMHPAS